MGRKSRVGSKTVETHLTNVPVAPQELGHRIDVDDSPAEVGLSHLVAAAAGSLRTLQEIERDDIAAVLHATGGNRTRTARQLGIGAATLHRKFKEYQLPAARE